MPLEAPQSKPGSRLLEVIPEISQARDGSQKDKVKFISTVLGSMQMLQDKREV